MPQPIDLYYWPTPNGWKISIAFEEMGLPYSLRPIAIGKGDQFAPDFLRLSPNNKIPAIADPDGPGGQPISVFESGAILLYLARKTGQFGASDARHQVEIDQWLSWQLGGVGPMAGQTHHFLKYAPEVLPYAQKRYVDETARLYAVLNQRLSDRRYVTGDAYTIADMAIWPWASLWEGQDQTLDDKPHLARWLEEIFSRPAVQRGRALMNDSRNDPKPDRYGKRL